MKKQVVDRLFLNAISMVVVAGAYLESGWAVHRMMVSGGWPAHVCMLFLAAASFVAMLDTVLNDMLPPDYTFHLALDKRRGIWMAIGITYAGIAFVSIRYGFGFFSASYFMLFSARSVGVAFLDLYYQYEPVVNDPTTPINPTIPGVLGDA